MIKKLAPYFIPFIVSVVIISLTIAGVIYMKSTVPTVQIIQKSDKVFFVTYIQASKKDMRPKVTFYGEAFARRKLRIGTEVQGVVMQTMPQFFSGSYVKEGQVIARLDPFDYQNTLKRHIITLEENEGAYKDYDAQIVQKKRQIDIENEQAIIASKDFERAEFLLKSKTLSKRDVEIRQKALNKVKQDLNKSVNDLRILKIRRKQQENRNEKSHIDIINAKKNLERTIIRAPFSGYIDEPNVEIGKQVRVGDIITTLVDANNADVSFTISDTFYGSILGANEKLLNRQIDIFLNYGKEKIMFIGKIIAISPQINATSGGINVTARVYKEHNNIHNFRLLPGNFVHIEIPDRTYKQVLEVHESSLYDNQIVYTINKDNRLVRHTVQIVGKNKSHILIKAPTIHHYDKIVTTNFVEASQGLSVKGTQLEAVSN